MFRNTSAVRHDDEMYELAHIAVGEALQSPHGVAGGPNWGTRVRSVLLRTPHDLLGD
jgi:hypothetical protein